MGHGGGLAEKVRRVRIGEKGEESQRGGGGERVEGAVPGSGGRRGEGRKGLEEVERAEALG